MLLNDLHVRCILAATRSKAILTRAWLLDSMTVTNSFDITYEVTDDKFGDIVEVIDLERAKSLKEGTVVGVKAKGKTYSSMVLANQEGVLRVAVFNENNKPILHREDVFKYNIQLFKEYLGDNVLTKSFLEGNVYNKDGKLEHATTVGRWLENMFSFQIPTEFKVFPYFNMTLPPDTIIKKITEAILNKKIDVAVYKKFVDYFFFLNHITEISVPSMTERSLVTSPKVAEFKKKFLAEHRDEMTDPLVIKQFEDECIKLDKEWLGIGTDNPDPSVTFFDGLGGKSYGLYRKKLFLTTGGIPAFDSGSGKYDFIENSLSEGWTPESIPSIANESRKGSYERGMETAKAGAETKMIYRVFQDLAVTKDDCGTKRTIKIDFNGLCRVKDFIGRVVQTPAGDVTITEENMSKFDGKVVNMYSPLTCAEPHDLCFKCCGARAKELYAKIIGIQVVNITSKFMTMSMKNMHGTVMQIVEPKLEDILL